LSCLTCALKAQVRDGGRRVAAQTHSEEVGGAMSLAFLFLFIGRWMTSTTGEVIIK